MTTTLEPTNASRHPIVRSPGSGTIVMIDTKLPDGTRFVCEWIEPDARGVPADHFAFEHFAADDDKPGWGSSGCTTFASSIREVTDALGRILRDIDPCFSKRDYPLDTGM